MKIAYVSREDPNDVHAWSGITLAMGHCLERDGMRVAKIGPLPDAPKSVMFRARWQLYYRVLRQSYWAERDPEAAQYFGRAATALLNERAADADVVLAPSTIPIAFMECRQPIVFWTDATFAGTLGFYHNAKNLCRRTLRNGRLLEQKALDRCRLAIYSSQWAADSAIKDYGVDPAKVKVVAFGANLAGLASATEAEQAIARRPMDRCKLVLIGVDWVRKGVDLAVAVAEELNAAGLATELTIVGCQPPASRILPPFVHVLGFVSKATEEGRVRLRGLLGESHFLILPSEADATPIVFAEASGMAVPSLTTDVGGNGMMVRDGVNGQKFALGRPPGEYAAYIRETLSQPERYRALCLSSFAEYQSRLNWDVAGRTVGELLALVTSQ